MTGASGQAQPAGARRSVFGRLDDGRVVEQVVLPGPGGMSVTLITLGAGIQAIRTPDRGGRMADIVLGYDAPQEYLASRHYLGVSIGRYANRIAHGRFTIDGREYRVDTNDGPNHLHGGANGFDRQLWSIDSMTSGAEAQVVFGHVSRDGDGGYPGELSVTATYTLTMLGELRLAYRATTSVPTIVSLTSHAYFNLSGDAATGALDHRLTLHAGLYTPVDATLIPTGERRRVAGTPFDFRQSHAIADRMGDDDDQLRIARGYDHHHVLDGPAGTLRPAVRLEHPASGRVLEIDTTAPGVQFYSGNSLDGAVPGKSGRRYRAGDGLCFEPQAFPDAPNRPDFPSARLDPGQLYENVKLFRFGVAR